MEDVVADGQVVFQPKRLQDDAIPYWERQPQLLVVVAWRGWGDMQGSDHYWFLGGKRGFSVTLPGGGGSAVIFGLMSGGKGGFTSGFGERYGGMLLPGVIGGVGLPGTGEWG